MKKAAVITMLIICLVVQIYWQKKELKLEQVVIFCIFYTRFSITVLFKK